MAAADTALLESLRHILLQLAKDAHPEIALPAGATAAEFAAVRFGGPTEIKVFQVTVGTGTVRLVDNNPRRVFWIAINNGVNSGAISIRNDVTTGTGIPVQSNGGAVSMDVMEDGEAVAWEWFAITGAAGQNWTVFVIERV